jgi:hypothetical protein
MRARNQFGYLSICAWIFFSHSDLGISHFPAGSILTLLIASLVKIPGLPDPADNGIILVKIGYVTNRPPVT